MTKTKPKIFVVISDGVSLRNFVYSNFYHLADKRGYDVYFLNTTVFELSELGLNEIRINSKTHPITNILKNVRKHIELRRFKKRFKDNIYLEYLFPLPFKGIKNSIKSSATKLLVAMLNSEIGLVKVRRWIKNLESKTQTHKDCLKIFKEYQPILVYNTSQRAVSSIALVQAAKQMKIPTLGFIYSWDNLPKATLDVETDYYHVWSEHMKAELLRYHNFIGEDKITVTGTPQFEPHFNKEKLLSREDFIANYRLNPNVDYICFSGDDITTSPKDPIYLRDLAEAVKQLNNEGKNIEIIFRRCPVDISDRYNSVIKEYGTIIHAIEPVWKPLGKVWDAILPAEEDALLLANIAKHCKLVVNLGSSMVFDFAAHNKPCAYFNYNYLNPGNTEEKGVFVYDYIHFKSMPSQSAVFWIDSKKEFREVLLKALQSPKTQVDSAKQWFKKINQYPFEKASDRILEDISNHL
ncbi:UDP-glycosyltransferase [Winogradskyella luteola]|uniref:UDP-glycosyltransferase n=1 Tax=Winogradskyella luteola TaxID=2828330 RepID=A0A9X1F9R0_9FLAO|nr:UDP-glycosyltransferase [Winogradskyella luteola]MBV7268550.1 UDP-glycosyltransferase [Winogradskyella luteola]